MAFNKEQTAAIEAPINKDVLISAGAGSGKTKTLSHRVSKLLKEGLEPSELLILTFTDNAAHEMKERIIKELKGNYPRVDEMYSAHIQTFDSFSSYLVKKYATRLGIADKITVASQSVIASKENEFLDQIFDEYYFDEEKHDKFINVIKKYNLQGHEETKLVVLSLYHQLAKILPSKRKEILDNYDEKYLSREFFDTCLSSFIEEKKKQMWEETYKIYLESNFHDQFESPSANLSSLQTLFSQSANFTFDLIPSLSFGDEIVINEFFPDYLALFQLKGEEFISKVKTFIKDHEDSMKGKKFAVARFNKIFKNVLKDVASITLPLDEEYAFYVSFKDDIHLIIDLVKELDERMFAYKKMSNFFTFEDISTLALTLMTDHKYEDVAEEVRERFKYIMVDEYQDTNDFQEEFIGSLLKENKFGERSHIFCVGDAKQSIYKFRNSNVALFRARQALYNDGNPSHFVIPMNKNYRSGPLLLRDINYIFNSYMTLKHGSICYKDEAEQLQYDTEVNLYHLPYSNFGIYRLISSNGVDDGWTAKMGNKKAYCKEWEARAIIKDIKNKIENSFPVYDRAIGGIRPCKYSDFAILMRKKKGSFELYQKVFNEEGIPLNNVMSSDLKEIDSVILVQSLIKMIDYLITKDPKMDPKHYFASIARSYAYQYDDETICRLLASNGDLYLQDPLYLELENFVKKYKDSSFEEIFLSMLTTFHVVDKLYLIGNVEDNISKIESIHSLVISSEQAGEGLQEFVDLLLSIDKYSLDLSADSVFQSKDAVDMMTIHASKGLERKVVYLPYSFNSMSAGSVGKKPDFHFDEKYGIHLPNYVLKENEDEAKIRSIPYDYALNAPSPNGNDNDEHVRLFYVALTRAENSIYIVGDNYEGEDKDRSSETLYGMLDYSTHYPVFAPNVLETMVRDKDLVRRYQTMVEAVKDLNPFLEEEELGSSYDLYITLFDDLYKNSIKEELASIVSEINEHIFNHLLDIFKDRCDSLDEIAKLHDAVMTHADISSFEEYLSFFSETKEIHIEIPDDEEEEPEVTAKSVYTKEELENILINFSKAVLNSDTAYFGFTLKDEDKNLLKFRELLLPALAKVYSPVYPIMSISYKTDEYPDHVEKTDVKFDRTQRSSKIPSSITSLMINVNDEEIEFEKKIKRRASKIVHDDDSSLQELFEYGTHLHRLLELYDFKARNLDYIKDDKDKKIIAKIIKSPIFLEASEADSIYQEYGYFDPVYRSNGFIDLMYRKGNHFTIVDYKSSNIDDPAYVEQLHTYQRNIERLFNVSSENISLYLLSIMKGEFKEVEPLK